MKVEELRIGNSIFDGVQNETVSSSMLHYLEQNKDESYKGIPLTEEWLLKFGFDVDYNDDEMSKQFHLLMNDYDLMLEHYVSDIDSDKCCLELSHAYTDQIGRTVYYVHQLQNLYFALTGEELTIKE